MLKSTGILKYRHKNTTRKIYREFNCRQFKKIAAVFYDIFSLCLISQQYDSLSVRLLSNAMNLPRVTDVKTWLQYFDDIFSLCIILQHYVCMHAKIPVIIVVGDMY